MKTLKSVYEHNYCCEWILTRKSKSETQRLLKAIIVLIRNTTWRCGKLERLIVKHLHRRNVGFGKPEATIKEMIRNFNLSGKKKNEFLDAVKRLERRNIIRILRIVN
jgi:transcription initiation factor TFIIIB Brf1 subunit/transcription initiation factor TFIIB